MTDESDELVERATRGEVDAVEALLEKHLAGLQGFVARNAGRLVGAKESSSDLVQSVCREVLERLANERFEYRGERAFKHWLYRAATLKLMNRHRYWIAGARDAALERPLGSTGDGGPIPETPGTPSEEAMLLEELERFRGAFAQLSEIHRRVVQLAHVEGRPHRAIADELGITEAHSRVLLSRAMARLARLGAPRP